MAPASSITTMASTAVSTIERKRAPLSSAWADLARAAACSWTDAAISSKTCPRVEISEAPIGIPVRAARSPACHRRAVSTRVATGFSYERRPPHQAVSRDRASTDPSRPKERTIASRAGARAIFSSTPTATNKPGDDPSGTYPKIRSVPDGPASPATPGASAWMRLSNCSGSSGQPEQAYPVPGPRWCRHGPRQ